MSKHTRPERWSVILLVDELVASSTQDDEPLFVQVIVVLVVKMMNVETRSVFVLFPAELAGVVPSSQYELAEHLPMQSLAESGSIF